MFRRFSFLYQLPPSFKKIPHQTLFNITSTKQHEITSNVIAKNSNKWREFLVKCGGDSQQQAPPSKQQQLIAISVTNDQWSSLNNNNNENNNVQFQELENWPSNDAFALMIFLSFNGNTPWALSAWRRCFVMKSSDLQAPIKSTSLMCYPVLATSHLTDVLFLLRKKGDKKDDNQFEKTDVMAILLQLLAKPELLNCCRKSLELARTLMNLFREEETESSATTTKNMRFIIPLIDAMEMKFVARIGLFVELVFFVENNSNNTKTLLSLTTSSSIEQETLKYWSQKLFVSFPTNDHNSKKESSLLQEIVKSMVVADDDENSPSCLEQLWRSLLPDQTQKTIEIINDFDLTLGRILLKQLPHFSAILPREIQTKITSEHLLFASADELLQFLISPLKQQEKQLQKSSAEKFLAQVLNLVSVQLPSLTNKNIPLKQWRAIAINLTTILRNHHQCKEDSVEIAIDDNVLDNFLEQIKLRISTSTTTDRGNEKNVANLVNAIGEIFPVLFQLLIEITRSSSLNVRKIFVDFEIFISWGLEKSLALSSMKIGSVKSDSALLFRCQSLFLILCHIRQYHFRSSVPKNMLNQIDSKTMTNLLLRFPHQISLWTLPAIEDSRFRNLFAKNIVAEFCFVHLEALSTGTHENARMKANWMLDRLKIFISVLDEMAGVGILENGKNNNIRRSHHEHLSSSSSSSSLLHKLMSDFVIEFSSTIFNNNNNSNLGENRNPALQFILNIATRIQLHEFSEATKNALERISTLQQYRNHHHSLQQQAHFTFSQNNAESFREDMMRIVENHRSGNSSKQSHQRQSSRFHSLMDETVKNEKNSWHQALQLCLDQLSAGESHQTHYLIPKVRDCHDRELFLSSSSSTKSSSSSLKILNQHYWLHLRRMISIGFEIGCWQTACGVLNTMGMFSSTISAGNFLYWRSVAVLRRTGRWEELMQLLTRRDGLLLLPDDARENDLVSSVAVASPQLLLTASVCSAIQRSGDFHLAMPESSSVNSTLLKIISILRSNGFDTKCHVPGFDNSDPSMMVMNNDDEVSLETKIDRTSLASLAKVFLRCDMEKQALDLLIPACYMVSKREAKKIQIVPSNVAEKRQHELSSQDREFYKNANSVFRELVKRGKWPKSQWELGVRFAQHNGRDDLAASISAKYVVGF